MPTNNFEPEENETARAFGTPSNPSRRSNAGQASGAQNPPHQEPDYGQTSKQFPDAAPEEVDSYSGLSQPSHGSLVTEPFTPASRNSGAYSSIVIPPLPWSKDQIIGKFKVVNRLGKGGFGEVWKVEDIPLGVFRAIKVLQPRDGNLSSFQGRFLREAQLMARLDDPHAVRIYDYADGPPPWIVMEFVDGQTLTTYQKQLALAKGSDLSSYPLPLALTTRILDQLCHVLELARSLGLVHRDLKPDNLMLLNGKPEGAEHLKVLDLGIAKIVNHDQPSVATEGLTSEANLPGGTWAFASPEQFRNIKDLDHRSDIYTVGVILYVCLCGRLPFEPKSLKETTDYEQFMDLLLRHSTEIPDRPSLHAPEGVVIPPEVEKVVMHCLEKDRTKRPQTAAELWQEFYRAAAPHVPGYQGSRVDWAPIPSTTPSASKNKILAGAGLAAALISGVVLFATMRGGSGTDPGVPEVPKREVVTNPQTPNYFEILKTEGWAPDSATDKGEDWPITIHHINNPERKFERVSPGKYIPAGYKPKVEQGPSTDWPKRLERVELSSEARVEDDAQAEFVFVPGGEFTMGHDDDRKPWSPAHRVTLSPFYMQVNEVTIGEMERYVKDRPQSHARIVALLAEQKKTLQDSEDEVSKYPLRGLNWQQARKFANDYDGDLPTEAQFEFVARKTKWASKIEKLNNTIPKISNNTGGDPTFDDTKRQVVSSQKNTNNEFYLDLTSEPEGIYDLVGGVKEFCLDNLKSYSKQPQQDPGRETDQALRHVVRGTYNRKDAKPYFREPPPPTLEKAQVREGDEVQLIGFRLVLECLDFTHVKKNTR